ncbi:hypothetical protein RIF29_16848 [Crotalaria pallida]|uniref:F-box domain-containing protein n=1 Tax=Crotalaria pallida TaxID=3830 RepID=A0AAN9IK42_CROPI
MGSFFSMANTKSDHSECNEVPSNETCKRQSTSSTSCEACPRLIPNLPDELSLQIIARLPRSYYLNLRLVSRKWKATIMSSRLYKVRKGLETTEEWLYLLIRVGENKVLWHALDPHSKIWQRLPIMPNVFDEEESQNGHSRFWMWNMVQGLFRQKDGSDEMPFCGCATGAVNGCLYVLGGFSKASSRCVLRYDPIQNAWKNLTCMSTGRAHCKTSMLNNKLYVVGGINQGQGGLIPLTSAEVFDPLTDTWSTVPSMPFSSIGVLPTAFLADTSKPIATGLISYKGRLYVPQSMHSWPFYANTGGEIYDAETNSWMKMPIGMGEGWPAQHAGTKLSAVVDGELYAFDPSGSKDNGRIKVYNEVEDAWKVVSGEVPVYELDDSALVPPYLLAGFHGKLHFITKDVTCDVVVLQVDLNNNLDSSPSTSSPPSQVSFNELFPGLCSESDAAVWKVVASRGFGQDEWDKLISCQVIDI